MNQQDMAEAITLELKTYFQELLDEESEHGDIGATSFKVVHDQLMDSQKDKLREVSGEKFDSLCESGSIISIGIQYRF